MESKRLQELLDRYWDGNTSLEEEKELKSLLEDPEKSEGFEKEKMLFQYFKEKSDEQLPEKAEEEVWNQISPTKVFSITRWTWNVLKVAAVVTVIFTAGWLVRNEMKTSSQDLGSFETPEEAYAETKRALEMLSSNLKKGRNQAAKFKAFSDAEKKAKDMMNQKETEEEKL